MRTVHVVKISNPSKCSTINKCAPLAAGSMRVHQRRNLIALFAAGIQCRCTGHTNGANTTSFIVAVATIHESDGLNTRFTVAIVSDVPCAARAWREHARLIACTSDQGQAIAKTWWVGQG